VKKRLALITTSAALIASSAVHAENQWGLTPYVGADVQSRHMNWGKGLGDNAFSHNSMQGNVYFGVKFSEYLAVEGGYESTAKKTRTVTVSPGDVLLGNPLAGTLLNQFNMTSRISGPHINLVGSTSLSDTHRLKLLGLVGVASLKANLLGQRTAIMNNSVFIPVLPNGKPFIKRKNLLRLGTALEHMLTDTWGVRVSVIWENTNKLKITASNGAIGFAQAKNSFVYGLGAFVSF
jgi:hypothetical protein